MNKSYSEALDYILDCAFRDKKIGITYLNSSSKSGYMWSALMINLRTIYHIDDYEADQMLAKLIKEEFLISGGENNYLITLKGLDWISKEFGGFTQERVNHINEQNRRVANEILMISYTEKLATWTKRLVIGTYFVGGATLLLVIIEILTKMV